MSDPRRMLDSDVAPHLRVLLEAGCAAEPDPSLLETTLGSLRAADLGVTSSGLSPLISSAVKPVLAGVLVLGAVAGVIWMLMAPARAPAPAVTRPSTRSAAPVEARPAERAEAKGPVGPAGDAEPGAAPRSSSEVAPQGNPPLPQPTAQSSTADGPAAAEAARKRSRASTTAQRDLVLRARAALDGGAPQQALTMRAGYETSFDELRFVPEVLSLRMQAHERLGNGDAAKQLARRIVTTYPRSPQAGRARQVLGDAGGRGE